MELVIYNQQETPEQIRFNHEELKQELAEKLQYYDNLTYTGDEIKSAKADRATLNKFKDAIEKRRKEVKAQCLKPYEDFEVRVKELVSMVDRPILLIDGQIKFYEEKVKAEKRAEIQAFYSETVGDLGNLLSLEKIWNEKWLNATATIKSTKDEITTIFREINRDLDIISSLQSEFEFQIKDVYLRTLNLSAALQEKTRLEEQKVRQEAYAKAQAEKVERAKQEAECVKQDLEKTVVVEDAKAAEVIRPEPQVMQIDLRVWVTDNQLEALKGFLRMTNIQHSF